MNILGFSCPEAIWSVQRVFCMCFHVYVHALVQLSLAWHYDWLIAHDRATSVKWNGAFHLTERLNSNINTLRIRANTFQIRPLAFYFISFTHSSICFHMMFIFFFTSKNHNSINVDPINVWFFAFCSSSCLVFFGYFSRNCARLKNVLVSGIFVKNTNWWWWMFMLLSRNPKFTKPAQKAWIWLAVVWIFLLILLFHWYQPIKTFRGHGSKRCVLVSEAHIYDRATGQLGWLC